MFKKFKLIFHNRFNEGTGLGLTYVAKILQKKA